MVSFPSVLVVILPWSFYLVSLMFIPVTQSSLRMILWRAKAKAKGIGGVGGFHIDGQTVLWFFLL